MVEIEGSLVVADYFGKLHVLTNTDRTWKTFVRERGNIRNVVCHQDVCLVLVYDVAKHRRVIEQFCLYDVDKWRFLTVLPNELQLDGVSVALHDNSLYVVGGETESGEKVNTARVCDLHSGHWSKMDDMQTRRSDCSSVAIDKTVFVGGGDTDRLHFSNIVECVDVRTKQWAAIASTTNCRSTLTTVSNRLVVTGGAPYQCVTPSAIVELYDEKSSKWLPLPRMTHERWSHAALSTQSGELITAGGIGEDRKWLTSLESLKCHY